MDSQLKRNGSFQQVRGSVAVSSIGNSASQKFATTLNNSERPGKEDSSSYIDSSSNSVSRDFK
jgi:hypothetical protein